MTTRRSFLRRLCGSVLATPILMLLPVRTPEVTECYSCEIEAEYGADGYWRIARVIAYYKETYHDGIQVSRMKLLKRA